MATDRPSAVAAAKPASWIGTSVPFYEGTTPNAYHAFWHDNLGRVVEAVSPEGRRSFHEYGFRSEASVDEDGNRHSVQYDELGRVWLTTDALGTTTCYEYGAFDQLERIVRNCLTGATSGAVDDVDDLEFEYDLYGNVVWSFDPDTGETSSTYSPGFLELASETDANGDTIAYAYDVLGRPTETTLPSGTISYTWDAGKIGMLDQISGPGFSHEVFEYDAFLRGTATETWVDGDSYRLEYNYAGGKLSSIDYPDGVSVQYAYDSAGFMREASVAGDMVWRAKSSTLLGLPARTEFGNDMQNTRSYDGDGFLNQSATSPMGPAGDTVEAMHYEWNSLGQLDARTDAVSGQSQAFEYDALYRLERASTTFGGSQTGEELFTYDRYGNLTTKTGVGTYSYGYQGEGNRVRDIGGVDYIWDPAGQLERRGSEELTWTDRGRLARYTSATEDIEHVYAGSGARTRTVDHVAASTTTFIGGLYQQTVGPEGTVQRFLVATADGVSAQLTRTEPSPGFATDEWEYLHRDHLGSPYITTDENGEVKTAVMYDAWGEQRDPEDWTKPFEPGADPSNMTLDYTGHRERLGRDLVNMNARYFDTHIGRALSADTIVPNPLDSQSFNRFSYVLNNPLSFTDPTGHAPASGAGAGEPSAPPLPSCPIHGGACPNEPGPGTTDEGWNPNRSLTGGESDADKIACTYGDCPGAYPPTSSGSGGTRGAFGEDSNFEWPRSEIDRINSLPTPPPAPCTGAVCAGVGALADTSRVLKTDLDRARETGEAVEADWGRGPGYEPAEAVAEGVALVMEEATFGLVLRGAGWALKALRARRATQGARAAQAAREARAAAKGGGAASRSVGAAESALSVAERGGRHAGFLQRVRGMGKRQLEKAHRTRQKNIEIHERYLGDPTSKVPNWRSLRPEHQKRLLRHWSQEIDDWAQQQSIIESFL